MLITIVSFIIVLGILVFIHEFGHYWVARKNGIVVEEFGMGYPPRLVKLFRYDGTDFTINLIPFGGFARMKGEDAGDMSPGSFNAASRGARAATLIAGPFMNALLAVILFAASFVAGFPAAAAYAQIGAESDLTKAYGLQTGDILLKINDEELLIEAFSEMPYDDIFKPEVAGGEQTLLISRDQQLVEIPLSAEQDIATLLADLDHIAVLSTEITQTAPGSPAEENGIVAGDLVYQVDDLVVTEDAPLNELIRERAGSEVTLTLFRDGEWTEVTITPRENPPEGQGSLGVVISPIRRMATLGLLPALWEGVVSTAQYFMLVLSLPFLLISEQMSAAEMDLQGPVGIAQMVGGAMSATIETRLWFPILRLSAVLSAALAVTNLLPLPALDGGRLLFIVIESIRGRRVSPEREGLVHMVGFVLLLGLITLITVRDITATRQGIDWISLLGQ